MDALVQGVLTHGPWAAFAVVMFFAYTRLVNDVLAVTRKDAEAFTENAEAVRQMTQVIIEVKDTIHKCRKT